GRYLLSASSDQTLRIWDVEKEEPLLSFFPAGDDWIAWTPEGYYACSPGGERLIGWHVDDGPERMANYYPAAALYKRSYRPDLIRGLLKAGSVERALEITGEAAAKPVAESLPPVVLITAPNRGKVTVDRPEIEVEAAARARSGQSVKSMRLLIDGRPFE